MSVSIVLFYLFSTVLLGAAALVVTARHMVHSVLFLILTFLNGAGLFILANAEFLAMVLVVVYVGAIAVLFLFIVMMLNEEKAEVSPLPRSYGMIGVLVGGILIIELIILAFHWKTSPEAFALIFAPYGELSNTEALGNILYTHYILIFQMAGVILLIAIIGAVVLTLRHREDVLRQKAKEQLARNPKESLRLVDPAHVP